MPLDQSSALEAEESSPTGLSVSEDDRPKLPGKSDEADKFISISSADILQSSSFLKVMKSICANHYNINSGVDCNVEFTCKHLYEKDYVCKVVYNSVFCVNYPERIIVPVNESRHVKRKWCEMNFDSGSYTKRVQSARCARIRSRFVVPVILFDRKFICRSGTLTCRLSAAYEQSMKSQPRGSTVSGSVIWSALGKLVHYGKCVLDTALTLLEWDSMSPLFKEDAEILSDLKVEHICDMMVEYAKEVLNGYLTVSLSEIKHKDIYRKFDVEDMPYPGCEFFKDYHEAGRNPKGLKFNWSETAVTRELHLSGDFSKFIPDMDKTKYKEWDLVELTQNYLKVILGYLVKDEGGILIHCISGWDRTPLFISLVRLSLWADKVIHRNLDYKDIAYLTVAYDWYLFGHVLPDRLAKGEELMHFCFNFLSYITDDEFSITDMFARFPRRDGPLPQYMPGRRERLLAVREYVLEAYDRCVNTS